MRACVMYMRVNVYVRSIKRREWSFPKWHAGYVRGIQIYRVLLFTSVEYTGCLGFLCKIKKKTTRVSAPLSSRPSIRDESRVPSNLNLETTSVWIRFGTD